MPYKINSMTGELSEYTFNFGGIIALRNFTARTNGERLIIQSAANANFSILDALVSEVEIDGVVYDNAQAAQEALQRLVFSPAVPVVLTLEEKQLLLGAMQRGTFNGTAEELKTQLEEYMRTHTPTIDLSGYLSKGSYTGTAQDLKTAIDGILTILNSPDTELDTLQEIVAYIKQNKQILSQLSVENIAGLVGALNQKVDKVEGKGLSSEDFTSELKQKLEGLQSGNIYIDEKLSKTQLVGEAGFIEVSANENVVKIDLHQDVKDQLDSAMSGFKVATPDGVEFDINNVDNTLSFTNSDNVSITSNESNEVNVSLKPNVNLGNKGSLQINEVVVDNQGISAGNKVIRNVASGVIDSASTYAVNGAQIKAIVDRWEAFHYVLPVSTNMLLNSSHIGRVLQFNNTSPITINISQLPNGAMISGVKNSTGTITFIGTTAPTTDNVIDGAVNSSFSLIKNNNGASNLLINNK